MIRFSSVDLSGYGVVDDAAMCAERAAARERALSALWLRQRLLVATATEMRGASSGLRDVPEAWRGTAADAYAEALREARAHLARVVDAIDGAAVEAGAAAVRLADGDAGYWQGEHAARGAGRSGCG